MKSEYLVIIPARGGSKRLPGKNILELNNKPLIAYSIEEALKCKKISKVVVTSDDDRILEISKKFGATTIKRPEKFATDTSSSFDAIKHAIKKIKKKYKYIVLLQPTSPLRQLKHIEEAIQLFEKKSANAVISVCEVEHPVQWTMSLDENLNMNNFVKNIDTRRSQEQKTHYRLNGSIYIIKTNKLLNKKTFFLTKNTYAYIMDKKYSIDIDDEFDFKLAECLVSIR